MKIPCKNIPTFDFEKNVWTTTSFNTQEDFGNFLLENCFKEPGEYNAPIEVVEKMKEHATFFTKNKVYTFETPGTDAYWEYWDDEEIKSRLGVIFKYSNDRIYYTTRDYYFLINFCVIVNKEKGYEETFADPRDGQYHMMLYEKIGEIFHQNTCCLKRRQFLYSFCHTAKTVNYLWFENRKRLKWFASDDSFLTGPNGSWSILDQYKTHLNNNTAWYRSFSPDTTGEIQQREKVAKEKGVWEWEGNESSVVAKTLKKDPKLGVGGPTFWAWYEEGGIAPTANTTLQFMEPAITSGLQRVGSFCIGGSVGDLTECGPLRNFMKEPHKYGMFAVPTKWWDETDTIRDCGLFIPAQYCMPEAMDDTGFNSQVDKALVLLHKAEFEGFKKGEYGRIADEAPWVDLDPVDYILKKSQSPKNIKEAFAWRTVSFFDVQKLERRQKAIDILKETKKYIVKQGLYEEGQKTGVVRFKELSEFKLNKPFEMGYPVDKKEIDKRGLVNQYEEYNPDFSYYGGVDSIEADTTITSDSLFSITIYRRAYTEIDITTGKRKTVRGKIVCDWAGRFDSVDETNEHGLLILRAWKAKAACERNRPNFINHCKRKQYHHLIAMKSELPFDKDVSTTGIKPTEEYGVYNDSSGKLRNDLKRTYKDYLNQEVETVHMPTTDGTVGAVVKTIRGYDLMDGYWTLEELKLYNEEDNFDRFYSSALAVAFGVAEELTFEKKVQIQTEQEHKVKEKPKPIVRNYLGNSRQYTNKTSKPRNLLNY